MKKKGNLNFLEIDLPEDRLAHIVKTAGHSYSRVLQVGLMEHSVSFGHWVFLRILWEHEGLTQKQLSNYAGVVEPTTHSALKTMEKLGYIQRRKAIDNRKNVYIYLTAEGKNLKEVLIPLAITTNKISTKGISAKDIAITRKTLLKINENLTKHEKNRAQNDVKLPSTRELFNRIKRDIDKK